MEGGLNARWTPAGQGRSEQLWVQGRVVGFSPCQSFWQAWLRCGDQAAQFGPGATLGWLPAARQPADNPAPSSPCSLRGRVTCLHVSRCNAGDREPGEGGVRLPCAGLREGRRFGPSAVCRGSSWGVAESVRCRGRVQAVEVREWHAQEEEPSPASWKESSYQGRNGFPAAL